MLQVYSTSVFYDAKMVSSLQKKFFDCHSPRLLLFFRSTRSIYQGKRYSSLDALCVNGHCTHVDILSIVVC